MYLLIGFIVLCLYVIIGGFLAAITRLSEDGLGPFMILLWPIALPIYILICLGACAMNFGDDLVESFCHFKNSIKRRKSK